MTSPHKGNSSEEGYWREPNDKVARGGPIKWVSPGKTGLQTWVGTIDGEAVASIRKSPAHPGRTCSASMEGWVWVNIPREFNPLKVKESHTRGFPSLVQAQSAISRAVAILQAPHQPQSSVEQTRLTQELSTQDRLDAAQALLAEVSGCFTREDDLPDGLLGRIDAFLDGRA